MAEKKTSEAGFDDPDFKARCMRGMYEWGGMPEYLSKNLKPHITVEAYFDNEPLPLKEAEAPAPSEEVNFFDPPPAAAPVQEYASLHVHFESDKDFADFCKLTGKDTDARLVVLKKARFSFASREALAALIGQTVTESTTYVWVPDVENMSTARLRYTSTTPSNPKYPVYIISKGRAETRLTAKALERMNVPYFIVVEPQEQEQYEAVIDFTKVLPLPCENFNKSDADKGWGGSIPARNFVWQHAVESGAKRHWIIDDNIRGFYRLNRNKKIEVTDGTIFRAAEDFVDRYENVGIAGFNYYMFAKHRDELPPFLPNRRIYSCILIKNDIDLRMSEQRIGDIVVPACEYPRWRGRYNEDTDLSIRAMKQGLCTVLFYSFLCYKEATMTMKGGNMDELYQGDGRLRMAQSLVAQHPDITTIYHKFGIQRNGVEVTQRAQHLVDYSGFKEEKGRNVFKLKPEFEELAHSQTINDYGMELKELADGSPVSE